MGNFLPVSMQLILLSYTKAAWTIKPLQLLYCCQAHHSRRVIFCLTDLRHPTFTAQSHAAKWSRNIYVLVVLRVNWSIKIPIALLVSYQPDCARHLQGLEAALVAWQLHSEVTLLSRAYTERVQSVSNRTPTHTVRVNCIRAGKAEAHDLCAHSLYGLLRPKFLTCQNFIQPSDCRWRGVIHIS